MGGSVSFIRPEKVEHISKAKDGKNFPKLAAPTHVHQQSNNSQTRLNVDIDNTHDSGCYDSHGSGSCPDSPFIIRSAISNNTTMFTTPARASSSRSVDSSSSRNHHSGPNSNDSRQFAARDAIDFLYRRTQLSEGNSPNENASDNASAADVFQQTAMSLGLDNDDLLFNMMFFEDGCVPNFGAMMNTMQQETLALHSENNTPYKLNPANQEAISHLIQEIYKRSEDSSDNECAVCKDEIDDGADIIRIPSCRHYFHAECLSRWIQLQAWCPVCRASLEVDSKSVNDASDGKERVAQTLHFHSEEKECCDLSCSDKDSEGDPIQKMRQSIALDSAEKFISTGLGRAVHREVNTAAKE